jgi:outer membrane lipoprotein-sorting protein
LLVVSAVDRLKKMIWTLFGIIILLFFLQLIQYESYNSISDEYNSIFEYSLLRASVKCCENSQQTNTVHTDLWLKLKKMGRTVLTGDSSYNKCYLAKQDLCTAISSKDEVYAIINNSEECSLLCFPLTFATRIYLVSIQFINIVLESISKK